ncbi:MAG: glycosyltransferase family 2 protein [Bacteroidetes bacterium]|nr:glycosyltransferase family 2 protein [Bacteroidota bacterium]
MKDPKVTVLILSYNGKHLLDEVITSYRTNTYGNFDIAVIDNGSTDGTEEYIARKYAELKLLRVEKNRGYSGGFNFGLEYAFCENKSDFVIITNNDVKADNNVIKELVEIAQADDRNGFVTGKVYFYERPKIFQTIGLIYDPVKINGGHIGWGEEDRGQYDEVTERHFADDVFMLVSRKLYEEVGGYDIEFVLQAEQFDWQFRAKKKGFKIMYTPYAKIWHKDSMTIGRNSPSKSYYDSRNPMIVLMKYLEPDAFRRYFWLHIRKDIIRPSLVNLKNSRIDISIKIWEGFVSAIQWGFNNNKLTIKHFIKDGSWNP